MPYRWSATTAMMNTATMAEIFRIFWKLGTV
jgi:hypothetical protein